MPGENSPFFNNKKKTATCPSNPHFPPIFTLASTPTTQYVRRPTMYLSFKWLYMAEGWFKKRLIWTKKKSVACWRGDAANHKGYFFLFFYLFYFLLFNYVIIYLFSCLLFILVLLLLLSCSFSCFRSRLFVGFFS